jgi:hypothetical protein
MWSTRRLVLFGARSKFPLSCQTGRGLGCGWYLGGLGILERDDLPLVLLLYDDQRWAGFYFACFVAFVELHVRSGEYHGNIGAQKTDVPYYKTGMAASVDRLEDVSMRRLYGSPPIQL